MSTTFESRSTSRATREAPPSRQKISLILLGIASAMSILIRLIPYGVRPPNVNASGSLGVFGGARTPIWLAIPAQLLPLVISDVILLQVFGWEPFNLTVYGSFIIYLLLGRLLLKGNDSIRRVAGVTFLGSLQFFLLTNFANWYGQIGAPQQIYDNTLAGLLTCFTAGLPFFGFTVAGDIGFGAVLFGAEAWLYGVVHGEKPAEAPEEVAS